MTLAGTSVVEFFERFPHEEACLSHIFAIRFGDHSPCPRCGGIGGWTPMKGTRQYRHRCGRRISLLEGTVFFRSKLSPMAWFYALLLFCNSSTGMRASFLRRQLGIAGNSAHRLGSLIRMHMASVQPARRLGGPGRLVHVDEAFIGHVAGGARQSPQIVMGMECDGEVVCGIIGDRSRPTLTAAIGRIVRPGSILVTDYHQSYFSLARDGWEHVRINHARAFHNFAGVTNNPIEGYWAVLKRTLRLYGRYSPDTLWRFLAEIQFRFNRRRSAISPFLELVSEFPCLGPDELAQLRKKFDWT